PIAIPTAVKIKVADGLIQIEGPKGKLEHRVPPRLSIEQGGDGLQVLREGDDRATRAARGLTRRLLANMVQGVSSGFSRTLEIVGVGYRAEARGQALHLSLGYSHPILFQLPPTVQAKVDRQTVITLES